MSRSTMRTGMQVEETAAVPSGHIPEGSGEEHRVPRTQVAVGSGAVAGIADILRAHANCAPGARVLVVFGPSSRELPWRRQILGGLADYSVVACDHAGGN